MPYKALSTLHLLLLALMARSFLTIVTACSGNTPNKFCCIADYDLTIDITDCVPIAELTNCVTPTSDTTTTFFVTCCNTKTSFEQTCYDGDCTETRSGINCAAGLHKRVDVMDFSA